ncbi:MAG: hypothetical protein Q9163_004942 [Psora crenata]
MHFLNLFRACALLSVGFGHISASPIAWPESVLEEINSLRARGMSEPSDNLSKKHEIASRYPRYFSTLDLGPLPQAPHVATASSTLRKLDVVADPDAEDAKPGKLHDILISLSSKLGLEDCDDQGVELEEADGRAEIDNEENWMYNGKSRLHERVGRRGQEMGKRL